MAETRNTLDAALPGYAIGPELGRGAFGVVRAGVHRQLGRNVAIKQLSPALMTSEAARSRFLAEAQVLASIDHPHIVPVFDYVELDHTCALVMERLAGGTVWRRFVDRGFDQQSACAVAIIACSGLNGAHRHGVLHRDMKPENIIFGDDGELKVTDFGLAWVLAEDDVLATRNGEVLGTPTYMAPEQASGAVLGPPTDVFAAAVMLYELLSGQLPFSDEGGSLGTVLRRMNEDAVPLINVAPTVPQPLSDAVMHALARDPTERTSSAEAFGMAIGEAASQSWGGSWLEGVGISLRDPGLLLASTRTAAEGTEGAGIEDRVVRPVLDVHTTGTGAGLVIDDLMPLRRTPTPVPSFPIRLTVAAGAVAAIALIVGLLGLGGSSPPTPIGPGAVAVAGHDIGTDKRIPIDLDRLIPVVVRTPPPGTASLKTAQIVLFLGGFPIVHSTTAPFVRQGHLLVTKLDASAGRYVVGGNLTATLKLSGSGGTVDETFGVHAERSPFTTFIGVLAIVLSLIVVADAESLLRSLRRNRRRDNRTAAVIGLAVVGAFGGLAAVIWSWMLDISGPTAVPFILTSVLGALAGLLAGLAARKVGDRNRARRRANRLVLVARRGAAPPAEEPSMVGVQR